MNERMNTTLKRKITANYQQLAFYESDRTFQAFVVKRKWREENICHKKNA
jgi:hypothetical protein